MRKYNETHPHLTFGTYLPSLPHDIWLNAGIAQSKCEEVGRAILTSEQRGDLKELYISRGIQATSAIEGNTLTEDEVKSVLQETAQLSGSKAQFSQEILNLGSSFVGIIKVFQEQKVNKNPRADMTASEYVKVLNMPSVEFIKALNHDILHNIQLNDNRIVPGEIFPHPTKVGNYLGAPVEDREYLLERLSRWIREDFLAPQPQHQLAYSLISAILAHLYLVWIHPFGDGNGRTARLIEFQILLAANVPETSAHLLSNHYNQTRSQYYHELDHGRKTKEVHHFLRYSIEGFIDQLNEQLATLKDYQMEAAWRDFVYRTFDEEPNSIITIRRRQVALDLWTKRTELVPMSQLRLISPKVAELFAGKSDQVVARDVKALEKMKMIIKKENQIQGHFGLLSGLNEVP